MGVSFDLNDTIVKIGKELNARSNARFSADMAGRMANMLSDYL